MKIKTIIFLRINYPKAILLTALLIISLFGLIVLRLVKSFRAMVFYSEVSSSEATHVYIEYDQETSDI